MRLSLGHISLVVDVDQTRLISAQLAEPDPACCEECATFVRAVAQDAFPDELVAFLIAAGAEISRPVETWGAADSDFLQVWWPIAVTSITLTAPGAVSVRSGMTVEVTSHFPRPPVPVPDSVQVIAVELTWTWPDVSVVLASSGNE